MDLAIVLKWLLKDLVDGDHFCLDLFIHYYLIYSLSIYYYSRRHLIGSLEIFFFLINLL